MTVTEDKAGFCTLCKSRCGAIYTISDDRLVGVRANPEHPTGAAMCPKGRAAPEVVHSPRRLTRPLRRTNPKTSADPGWQEISWEEAMSEIATTFDRIRTESGPEAVGFCVTSPSGTPLSDSWEWVERFIRLFGSPNDCFSTEICNWHKDFGHVFTYGTPMGAPDYRETDLALLWGQNPARTWLAHSTALAEAKERGAQVAVVDPRRAGSGLQADHWLRVRPGADGALALGFAQLLITQDAYDDRFIRQWSNAPFLVREDTGRFLRGGDLDAGLPTDSFVVWDQVDRSAQPYDTTHAVATSTADRLALTGTVRVPTVHGPVDCRPAFQRYLDVCAEWTPARTAATTWVPERTLREFGEVLAAAGSVAYYSWSGLAQHTNATQTERAIALLYALKGSFDAPGGNLVLPKHPVNPVTSPAQLAPEQRQKALGLGERPIGPPAQGWITARDLYTAMVDHVPYRVRALMGFGANSLVSQADPQRGRQALMALDFHVHCDLFMNPTAQYADIVLPVNSPFEREALRVGFEANHEAQEWVQLRQQMIPSLGETRSDIDIVFDLATRLGLGEEFFGGDVEAGWNHVIEPLGLTVDDLRQRPEGFRIPLPVIRRKYAEPAGDGVAGFATESRRVEIYSELLARHGYDPLPRFVEPAESPVGEGSDPAFPYVLTCASNANFVHSQHRGVASLRAKTPEPSVDLSPELAAELGIGAGEWAVVSTRHGRVRLRVRIDENLHPRVVVSEYGWWEATPDLALPGYDPFGPDGANYNGLIGTEHADPISGSVPHRSYACAVARYVPEQGAVAWPGERPFTVADVRREAEDTVSVTLEPVDEGPLPDHRPGQHVTVRLAEVPRHGSISRSYSLSGPAVVGGRNGYRITVKLLRDSAGAAAEGVVLDPPAYGAMSEHITRRVRVGDVVHLGAPAGGFAIPAEHDQPIVLVAGGVGITPFMSYLETLLEGEATPDVTLLYSSRNGAHHVFKDRIRALGEALPNLRVVNFYTRPEPSDALGVDYEVRGRITAAAVDQALIDRRARFYLCATDPMMRDLRAGLVERGVPDFDIFHERFISPTPTLVIPDGATQTVYLARSQRGFTWRKSDGSLLSAAESAGVSMPSGCRVGQCENCLVNLVSGSVQYLQDNWEAPDDAGCLTCQAVPVTDVVLDL